MFCRWLLEYTASQALNPQSLWRYANLCQNLKYTSLLFFSSLRPAFLPSPSHIATWVALVVFVPPSFFDFAKITSPEVVCLVYKRQQACIAPLCDRLPPPSHLLLRSISSFFEPLRHRRCITHLTSIRFFLHRIDEESFNLDVNFFSFLHQSQSSVRFSLVSPMS